MLGGRWLADGFRKLRPARIGVGAPCRQVAAERLVTANLLISERQVGGTQLARRGPLGFDQVDGLGSADDGVELAERSGPPSARSSSAEARSEEPHQRRRIGGILERLEQLGDACGDGVVRQGVLAVSQDCHG